jgi:hypothetical protein
MSSLTRPEGRGGKEEWEKRKIRERWGRRSVSWIRSSRI